MTHRVLQLLLALALALALAGGCGPSVSQHDDARAAREDAARGVPAEAATLELPDPMARERALAHLREGRELRARGEVEAADRAFDQAITLAPAFAEWTHVVAASAAAAAGDPAGVARRLNQVGGGAASEWGWRAHG